MREEMAGSGLYVMYTYKASEDASATNTDPLLSYGYSRNVDVRKVDIFTCGEADRSSRGKLWSS